MATIVTLRELWRAYHHASAQDVGITPLHRAAFTGDIKQIQALIKAKINVDAQDLYGLTPLHDAAMQGNREAVIVLLAAHPHVNIQDTEDYYTPLHDAVRKGYSEIVLLLLNAGARTDIQDREHLTPLACAQKYGQNAIVALLEAKNIQDKNRASTYGV